jgi:hypothetical protein
LPPVPWSASACSLAPILQCTVVFTFAESVHRNILGAELTQPYWDQTLKARKHFINWIHDSSLSPRRLFVLFLRRAANLTVY